MLVVDCRLARSGAFQSKSSSASITTEAKRMPGNVTAGSEAPKKGRSLTSDIAALLLNLMPGHRRRHERLSSRTKTLPYYVQTSTLNSEKSVTKAEPIAGYSQIRQAPEQRRDHGVGQHDPSNPQPVRRAAPTGMRVGCSHR